MAISQDLTGILPHLFDRFKHGDVETIKRDIFAPDIVWIVPGRHPMAGTMRGPDEVLGLFQQLARAGIELVPIGLSQMSGNIIVAFLHEFSTRPLNGAQLDFTNCLHCEIVNGKIQRSVVYVSDQYLADNFFNVAFSLKPIPDRMAR